MNEHEGPVEKRPLVITDLVEKGWQKPVRKPMLDALPMGLPQVSPARGQPQGTGGSEGGGGEQGGGGGAQGNDDA